jgi:hypothetical protein
MRAMRRAKCIIDEQVAKLRECTSERLVVALLAAQEASVFEQQDVAIPQLMRCLYRFVGVRRLAKDYMMSAQRFEDIRDGL